MIEFLPADDNPRAKRYSSVSQHTNKLSVLEDDEWIPIVFDELIYINCDEVKTEPTALLLDDDIGYTFPVGREIFVSDVYVMPDDISTETLKLDPWFGEGFYQHANNDLNIVDAENGSFGVRDIEHLNVGLDYSLANETLEPEA